jgi:hypothetical protein
MLAMVSQPKPLYLRDFRLNPVTILFLASKEAGWITGLIMPVDGGVSSLNLHTTTWAAANTLPQTTAGKADRPALKADKLAEANIGIQN